MDSTCRPPWTLSVRGAAAAAAAPPLGLEFEAGVEPVLCTSPRTNFILVNGGVVAGADGLVLVLLGHAQGHSLVDARARPRPFLAAHKSGTRALFSAEFQQS